MAITKKMEFEFPSMPLMPVLFSFLLFVFMIFITSSKKPKTSTKNLPPGPWKLPIIGNIHNLLGSSLPHHTFYRLSKKYGPLMHLQLGQVTTIVISSLETAEQVLKTHDLIFSNRPFNFAVDILNNGSDLVFAPYGDYWRQVKKVCVLELLSAKRVQSFRSIREDEVSKILRLISDSEGSVINFSKILFSYTNSVTSRAAFGRITKDTLLELLIINYEFIAFGAVGAFGRITSNNYEFIPFGAGRRICPGIAFASANIELLLASFLYHFDWKLSHGMNPEDLDTNEAFGAAIGRENYLNLIPVLSRPLRVA